MNAPQAPATPGGELRRSAAQVAARDRRVGRRRHPRRMPRPRAPTARRAAALASTGDAREKELSAIDRRLVVADEFAPRACRARSKRLHEARQTNAKPRRTKPRWPASRTAGSSSAKHHGAQLCQQGGKGCRILPEPRDGAGCSAPRSKLHSQALLQEIDLLFSMAPKHSIIEPPNKLATSASNKITKWHSCFQIAFAEIKRTTS